MPMEMQVSDSSIAAAFVLGAGLGTRLRPLTADWPKPLLAVGNKPGIAYAFDQVIDAGVRRLIVNTHHCAERYAEVFPGLIYRGVPIALRHEPVLLETGGGIKNIEDLVEPGAPLLIYNGDIVSTLPLSKLMAHHQDSGNEVTLALRSAGGPLQIHLGEDGLLRVIGNRLGTDAEGCYLFAGIYIIEPSFFERLTPGKKESVIPIFLDMIRRGDRLGGVVLDGGEWSDIGTLDEYEQINRRLGADETHLARIRLAKEQASTGTCTV